jgi:hypothetical protein
MYRHVIDHNPHVDEVWEISLDRRDAMAPVWSSFEQEARERCKRNEFDDAYFTQISPAHYENFDGTVRASIFRGYPRPITVPVTPVIRLGNDEIERVTTFVRQHHLGEDGPAIIFECSPLSGQSFMTPQWAVDLAKGLQRFLPGIRVVMSSAIPPGSDCTALVDGSTLRFREFAELTRHCALLVGCSSGLTWLCTSDAARPIPMIQLLSKKVAMYGAVVHDLQYWGLPHEHVIEIFDEKPELALQCVVELLTKGVSHARSRFHEPLNLRMNHYFAVILSQLRKGKYLTAARSLRHTVERYGLRGELIRDFALEVWRQFAKRAGTRKAG